MTTAGVATGCIRQPRCRPYDCQRSRDFATTLLDRYASTMDPAAAEMARGDFDAGEWEVAAISIIETGPDVSTADIDELEALAACFDAVDKRVADLVIAKRRAQP